MINRPSERRSSKRKSQRGLSIVSALLALLIGSIVTNGVIQNLKYRDQQDLGFEISKRVNPYRIALNRYISENYPDLQTDQPIVRNGTTIMPGTANGQTMAPTVTDLINLGYLPAGFNTSIPIFDMNAVLVTSLQKAPAGCVGPACEIPGYTYINSPIRRNLTEPNAVAIGKYRTEIGPDSLISLQGTSAQLTSAQGMSVANPVSGTPAGVVGVLVGWGASDYGQYLVVNDKRNPNFRGELTVKGEIKSETKVSAPDIVADNSVGAGTGNNGTDCRLGEILSSGQILSRSATCLTKVAIDPVRASITTFFDSGTQSVAISGEDSSITVNRSSGVQSIRMVGNTSEIVLKNAAGVDRASINGDAGAISLNTATGVKTVNLNGDTGQIASTDGANNRFQVDNTGNLRVRATGGTDKGGFDVSDGSGRVFGEVVRASLYGTKGNPCGSGKLYGDIAQNSQSNGLLMCNGSVWVPITSVAGEVNGYCPTNDEIGIGSSGASLICSGNKWVSITERFGKRVFFASYLATDGSWIPKPSCQSGTSGSIIILTPKNIKTDRVAVNHYATDYGSSWAVSIVDNLGISVVGESIAQTFCIYN